MTSEPDLQIKMHLGEDGYDVVYSTPAGIHYETQGCDRKEMVQLHVAVIRDVRPQTVVIVSPDGSTALHPGAVKAIVEGKLGPQELTLGAVKGREHGASD
jgi:hypothetical protein